MTPVTLMSLTKHFPPPSGHLLRGEELPGPLLRVHERLPRHVLLPEPVPVLQGGARLLRGVRPQQLHGQPVLHEEGRVLWLPEHDGHERLHPVLPHDPHGEILHLARFTVNVTSRENTLYFKSPFIFSHHSTGDPTGWGSTRGRTSEARCTRWWTTATTPWTVTACPTACPATWRRATGWCTSSPSTEAGWCTWGPTSTGASWTWAAAAWGSWAWSASPTPATRLSEHWIKLSWPKLRLCFGLFLQVFFIILRTHT